MRLPSSKVPVINVLDLIKTQVFEIDDELDDEIIEDNTCDDILDKSLQVTAAHLLKLQEGDEK